MSHRSNLDVPCAWADYEREQSPRQESIGSISSHGRFHQGSPAAASDHLEIPRPYGHSDDLEEASQPRR